MKKTLLLTAAALALVSFNANAAESATGSAQVEIVQAVSITHDAADKLNFGKVYAKNSNTVVISQAGAKTSGDAIAPFSADHFTISGPNGGSVTFHIDSTATLSKEGGGSITATLDPSVANGATVNLSGSDVVINVGGSLPVTGSTAVGEYTGTYTASISY